MIIARITIFAILFVFVGTLSQPLSQSPPKGRPQARSRDNNSAVRQNAILVLDSAIGELREVEEIRARVSMAETIVKLLAKSRPERCRNMLDSLFEAALRLRKVSSSNKAEDSNTDSILKKIIQIATIGPQVGPVLYRPVYKK